MYQYADAFVKYCIRKFILFSFTFYIVLHKYELKYTNRPNIFEPYLQISLCGEGSATDGAAEGLFSSVSALVDLKSAGRREVLPTGVAVVLFGGPAGWGRSQHWSQVGAYCCVRGYGGNLGANW